MVIKRCHRSRRNQFIFGAALVGALMYYFLIFSNFFEPDLDITRRISIILHRISNASVLARGKQDKTKLLTADVNEFPGTKIIERDSVVKYIELKLQEALKEDKGTGCNIPELDPFSPEVMQFDEVKPQIKCNGPDWVTCYLRTCNVKKEMVDTLTNIECAYSDILYHNDNRYTLGPEVKVKGGGGVYVLNNSDHVRVTCFAQNTDSQRVSWKGYAAGLRATEPKPSPRGRENALNVLIFGFDSTSRNGFIRKMPKSYKKLNEMKATFLKGFNVLGDGTPATLFPMLTGKTELELPDVRRTKTRSGTIDNFPFVFYKLKDDGYRTAYFEDSPFVGTFQYRFNGFKNQPTDHYLRAFFLEEGKRPATEHLLSPLQSFCVGDTPRYKLMMNLTQQFLKQDGKKFIFTFVADITHDNFNWISTSDEDFVGLLQDFLDNGWHENTILFVMGDHGPRYAKVRKTIQGKLEERLPLMSILLPERLKRERPNAQRSLEENAKVLTTPHDIYATYLDAIGLRKYWNDYKVKGADLTRGMTLLEPIPSNRSCSEAGVEPHWCSCLSWARIHVTDPIGLAAANAFIAHINELTKEFRSKCEPRFLISIEWVMKQQPNKGVLTFEVNKDPDGYVGKFTGKTKVYQENYQIKVVVGPGHGIYEASLVYRLDQKKFIIDTRDISRTNAYNKEPSCISDIQPSLNMYCYCKDHVV